MQSDLCGDSAHTSRVPLTTAFSNPVRESPADRPSLGERGTPPSSEPCCPQPPVMGSPQTQRVTRPGVLTLRNTPNPVAASGDTVHTLPGHHIPPSAPRCPPQPDMIQPRPMSWSRKTWPAWFRPNSLGATQDSQPQQADRPRRRHVREVQGDGPRRARGKHHRGFGKRALSSAFVSFRAAMSFPAHAAESPPGGPQTRRSLWLGGAWREAFEQRRKQQPQQGDPV